jgi:hypothetical protein
MRRPRCLSGWFSHAAQRCLLARILIHGNLVQQVWVQMDLLVLYARQTHGLSSPGLAVVYAFARTVVLASPWIISAAAWPAGRKLAASCDYGFLDNRVHRASIFAHSRIAFLCCSSHSLHWFYKVFALTACIILHLRFWFGYGFTLGVYWLHICGYQDLHVLLSCIALIFHHM